MRFFRFWVHDTEGLERAKEADAAADESLREARATAQWAVEALRTNGFADKLILIMRGEAT